MFGQNRKRLQTFVQPSDDDQKKRRHIRRSHITWKKLYFLPRKGQRYSQGAHEFSENGKNKAIKINLGHVLTNVRTIQGRSTFEKSPHFQQMKEEQPIQ